MKLEKKHWVIIGVIVAIIVIWYLFFKKKKSESGYSVGRGYDPGQNLLLYHGRPLVGGDGESGYAMSNPVTRESLISLIGTGKVGSGTGRICWDPTVGNYPCGTLKAPVAAAGTGKVGAVKVKMPVERHMPSGNKTCSCYINGYWTRWDCKTPCPETT